MGDKNIVVLACNFKINSIILYSKFYFSIDFSRLFFGGQAIRKALKVSSPNVSDECKRLIVNYLTQTPLHAHHHHGRWNDKNKKTMKTIKYLYATIILVNVLSSCVSKEQDKIVPLEQLTVNNQQTKPIIILDGFDPTIKNSTAK